MRNLEVDASEDPVSSEILLALQLRAANDYFLPKLEYLGCVEVGEAFIPFIPAFISKKTDHINISFTDDSSALAIAFFISKIPTFCPNLECAVLKCLARDPAVIDAVSEMLLSCNQGSLRRFYVDSPLTKEAQKVICRLSELSGLWLVIQARTLLPTLALPNLKTIDVEFEDHLDWLEGFCGATLQRLEQAYFRTKSEKIGDLIGAFESVALSGSYQEALLALGFYTSHSWSPKYSSLLRFKQLKELEIEFPCDDDCSLEVDDNVITTLSQAMPKLELLRLGRDPCQTPTGVTVNGLIGLARRCPHLSTLRVHFQAGSLVKAGTKAVQIAPSEGELVSQRGGCALKNLEVGEIPIPKRSASKIAFILLQIFPRLLKVEYLDSAWEPVAATVQDFRRIGAFVYRVGETHHFVQLSLVMCHQESKISTGPIARR